MSRQELELLVDQLRNSPLSFEDPVETLRPTFDGVLATLPVPEVSTVDGELGGVRVTRTSAAESGGGVLLYLHGGGYVAGSSAGYSPLWMNLAEMAGVQGIAVDYRLAPEHVFPAAVDDVVAVYRALLDEGIPAHRISIAGDSAGGGLALSLLVVARDAGLPMPSCAALFSPWVDLSCTSESIATKVDADPSLSPKGLRLCATEYLGSADASEPLASPLLADLTGLPPLHIVVGTSELLLDDATLLAAKAAASNVRTSLEAWPGLMHVFPLFSFALSEGRDALETASSFIRQYAGAATPEPMTADAS